MADKLCESINKPLVADGKKILSGTFTVLDKFNQNIRKYPKDVYTEAYDRDIKPKMDDHRLMGELDHPLAYDEVRLSNVSHVITDCKINENGEVSGTVQLLDTPSGLVAQALVEAGIPLGISSRGLGATKKVNGGSEVTKLKLITYDLVAEPSFQKAILLSESAYNHLSASLQDIESSMPLDESVETEGVRGLISRIRESVQIDESSTLSTDPGSEMALFEELMSQDTDDSLRESVEIKEDEITSLKGIIDSKIHSIQEQTKLIRNQQKIIDGLKVQMVGLSKRSADVEGMNEIVESLGQMTFANEETEFRLDSLQKNMDDLQESYNDMASKLGEATEKLLGSEEKLKESVSLNESLSTEVVELRKRLAVEARGLSWDRYSTLLEGVTTDREISEKLDSLSHYSGSSKRFDAKGLKDVLKESEVPQNDHSSSLMHIVSQV